MLKPVSVKSKAKKDDAPAVDALEVNSIDALEVNSIEALGEGLLSEWYLGQLDAEVQAELLRGERSQENVFQHYLDVGSQSGLSPVPTFSVVFYRARYADLLEKGEDPLLHYIRTRAEGLTQPHPLLAPGAPLDLAPEMSRHASPLFDPKDYLQRYPDVRTAQVDPLYHFFGWGLKERRSPHALFDTEYYQGQASGAEKLIDPFAHYVALGWKKDRRPHPTYKFPSLGRAEAESPAAGLSPIERVSLETADIGAVLAADTAALLAGEEALATSDDRISKAGRPATGKEAEALSGVGAERFVDWDSEAEVREYLKQITSPAWYLFQCDPLLRRRLQSSRDTLDAICEHYRSHGSAAGLSLIYSFSTAYYRARYSEALAGEDPLIHYVRHGKEQGLVPHPLLKGGAELGLVSDLVEHASDLFDADAYLAMYPDVGEAGFDPLRHYFMFGLKEGRTPHPLFDIDFYISQVKDDREIADPFVHYLSRGWLDGLSPHLIFDVDHYQDQLDEQLVASPLEHYLLSDLASRTSLHPLFDIEYYRTQIDARDRAHDPIVHFLLRGAKENLDPHPLFDSEYAQKWGGYRDEKRGSFLRFLEAPFSGGSFHPLFRVKYYKEQVARNPRPIENPLLDYIRLGVKEGLSPYPLFDPEFYASQLKDEAETADLLHYLTKGYAEGYSPHPLFDPKSYVASVDRSRRNECPLSDYVRSPVGTKPHYLFDENHFVAQIGTMGICGLERYVVDPTVAKVSTHPLFDPEYYTSGVSQRLARLEWQAKGDARKKLLKELDPAEAARMPLLHYLEHGHRYGISPARSFDVDHYRQVSGIAKDVEPMRHYLLDGGQELFSPHPVLDLEYYRKRAAGFSPDETPIFLHLLSVPQDQRASTAAAFDRHFYVEHYHDIKRYNLCPILHYINHGMSEGRRPNHFFSASYIDSKYRDEINYEKSPLWEYFSRNCGSPRPRILFIGHDASRTGAPLILLKIIEGMNAAYDIDAYCILGSGGALQGDFAKAAHCYTMGSGLDRQFLDLGPHNDNWLREMDDVNRVFGATGPDLVVCNTAETRAFADYFHERDVPVVSLVHEAADFYDAAQFKGIYESSKLVVFPSEYTMGKAARKAPFDPETAVVRGQGLLDPAFGTISREVARNQVIRAVALPDDARIVLGCGTMDTRKGIDLFVDTALRILQDESLKEMPVYFVWVGGGATYSGPDAWARRRVEAAGLQSRIVFAGAKDDTEPYYRAAEALLMTSRMDPFPCVIHEAMACRLPVIGFDGCTGAPEALEDSGIFVEPENTEAMASELARLLTDETLRTSLGERSFQLVAEKWQFAQYVEDLAGLFADHAGVDMRLPDPAPEPLPRPGKIVAERRKIYFSSPDWGISGVNTFTYNLVKGLNEKGFDARILFTNGRHGYLPSPDVMPDLPKTFLPIQNHHFNNVWQTLNQFLKEQRPCIYIPNYDYVASALTSIMHPCVGVIGIAHSDDVEHYEHTYRLGRYWDRVVSVSKFIEGEIQELNPSFTKKTSTIYYGVPFDEGTARRRVDAADYSPDRPLVLTYSGRLVTYQKNVLAYAQLAERLMKANVPFKLNILGDGDQYENLRQKLAGLVDSGIVYMPGRVTSDEVAEVLEETDVFVLLSDFEGLPLSMLEAMAKGVIPVIRDMKSGIPEVVQTGKNGFITARHDLSSMVEVLKNLQTNPEQRRALGHAVIDSFIEHRLSTDAMVEAYAALCTGLFEELDARPLPRPAPLAYNAPVFGISAPPFLQMRE